MVGRGTREILADACKLAREYYLATGKPLGITGEIGEFEAARLLRLTLAPARAPGYDALDDTGRKFQIKTRVVSRQGHKANPGQRLGSIRLNHEWDTVLLVMMNDLFEPLEIWAADRSIVEDALMKPGSRARNERGALSIRKFRSIGHRVWPLHQ